MTNNKKVTIDGSTAVAHIAYAMNEVAAIYPITPSTTMSELCDEWSSKNKKNIFDSKMQVVEMQSEAGAAGVIHGSLAAGALTTTFTSSQGLLLMIPNMYKIAGELLPTVFHVATRTVATHAINIYTDHSDVMACRQTGFAMLASNNVQETMDMALIAQISTLKSNVPFIHFFDGFRTSHEINKISEISYETIKELTPYKDIERFKLNAHNPVHPKLTGSSQNLDIFFQNREANNIYYNNVYSIVEKTMNDLKEKTGRDYKPFEYYGAKDAKQIIVAMCSANDTIAETIDILNKQGHKYGLIKVRLYRPFNAKAFCNTIPNSAKIITVLDRTKEPGSVGEPLYLDVASSIQENKNCSIKTLAGRYGLGGKDFIPDDVISVFENMLKDKPMDHFSVGINDDVTNNSLPTTKKNIESINNIYQLKFFGLGSDGTISANKNSIKIIGENTEKYVQGFFEYDSKKSGGMTVSHLRVSDTPILRPYLIQEADFIAIHNYSFLNKFDILNELKENSKVLLNTPFNEQELGLYLPQNFKKHLLETKSKLYVVAATKVAKESGLGNKINVIMQSCFFKITKIIDHDLALKEMKDSVIRAYGKKGEEIINANMKAIENATNSLKEISVENICAVKSFDFTNDKIINKYYKDFIQPIEQRKGDELKISSFNADGSVPTGTSQYEKRGIGTITPKWLADKCIQCGQCVLVCPHAAIRSGLLTKKQAKDGGDNFVTKPAFGVKDAEFTIKVSPYDCTGCENCARTCPVKALEMVETTNVEIEAAKNFKYFISLKKEIINPFGVKTVKGIQFEKPYFEFSGACAGCGETPYIKAITQLFGPQMYVANATGCSSIYSSSSPSCPYTFNEQGHGPTWANSLFEDNAEFGLGMKLATDVNQIEAQKCLAQLLNLNISKELKIGIETMINANDSKESIILADKLVYLLKNELEAKSEFSDLIKKALNYSDMFSKKTIWIFGGDGWAYDIGFGGLDHVIANGKNVNILVMDTEVYSNTGGQSSKSTPIGAITKFAADGKISRKKNLALIAMTYKDVYIAQVSLGANQAQFLKAISEAESYNGPSLIIAYSPCINHGINMASTQQEEKKAVEAGYWYLFRYDPRKDEPLSIDSQEPIGDFFDFVSGENRYAGFIKKDPEKAKLVFEQSRKHAKESMELIKASAACFAKK